MYGKIFDCLFTGSMYGAGAAKFAVMSYVIANMKPDKVVKFQVELNPMDLSHRIGEPESTILEAIEYLCSPDPRSRSAAEGGRRLVKLGPFDYRVVNGEKYANIKSEENRREANRIRQQRHRKSKKLAGDDGKPVGGKYKNDEKQFVQALEDGDEQKQEQILDEGLPRGFQ